MLTADDLPESWQSTTDFEQKRGEIKGDHYHLGTGTEGEAKHVR